MPNQTPDKSNNPISFWQELKRRKVIRIITVYAAAAFVILELVSIIEEPLQLPDWTLELVIVLLCIGFIITVIFSWIYDITPEGIEKTKPAKEAEEEVPEEPSGFNVWKIATFISVVIIVGLIIFNILGHRVKVEDLAILDKSIAVLPFKSLSDDPEKQYLADGAMDAIMLHLSKIKDLRVLARTSVQQYRNTEKTATEICQELNVSYLLEGSFQKYGDQARLIVQLIQPGIEGHAWANEYNRNWNDIFSVQSEVARSIARELKAVITPDEQQLIEVLPTSNMTAYDLYLRGLYYYNLHTNWWEIADYFERAIQLDSSFALAYVKLAQCYQFINRYSYKIEGDTYSKAKQIVLKAIDLDPSLGDAYAALGLIMAIEDWDIYGPDKVFKQAIRLSPGSSEVYSSYAQYLRWLGRYEESITQAKRALELDPLNPLAHQWLAGFYSHAGNFKESNHRLEQVLNLNPDYFHAYLVLAMNNTYEEKYNEAIKYAENAMRYDPVMSEPIFLSWLTYIFGKAGQEEKARQLLQKIIYTSNQRFVDPGYLALAYTGLGEVDSAFSQLSKGYEMHSGYMIYLRAASDGTFRDISADPRYRSLLAKMGFKD